MINSLRFKNIGCALFVVMCTLSFSAVAAGYADVREIDRAQAEDARRATEEAIARRDDALERKERQRQVERNSDAGKRRRIEASKAECASLGFRPETEDFGRCVLQLVR
jgi:hypothetical protein